MKTTHSIRGRAKIDNFRDKYTKSGWIGQKLIENFYSACEEIITPYLDDIENVLEVGIGEGFSTQRLLPFFSRNIIYHASEYDPTLAQKAIIKNPGIPITQESIYALNRRHNSYDLVICLEVLEHLEHPHIALSELERVSNKLALISVPREPLWRVLNISRGKYLFNFGNTPGHIQHWSSGSISKLCSNYFNVIEIKKPLPWSLLLLQTRQP